MIKTDNLEAVETAKKDLEAVWFPIAEEIYKSQAPNDGMGANGNPFANGGFDPTSNPFAK